MADANETAGSRSAVTSVERAADDLWKAELWQRAAVQTHPRPERGYALEVGRLLVIYSFVLFV